MTTTIAGCRLTDQQRTVLDCVIDHVRRLGGDSAFDTTTSPKGDGRWVPLLDIFPARNAHHNGLRRVVNGLHRKGILAACELKLFCGCIKAIPAGDPQWTTTPKE